MIMKSIAAFRDNELRGKCVLLWTDVISPLSQSPVGMKFDLALPTIKHLCTHGAKTVIAIKWDMSKRSTNESHYELLNQTTDALRSTLHRPVRVVSACDAEAWVNELQSGEVLLLKDSVEASASWTQSIDIFVNDLFGSSDKSATDTGVYCVGIQFENVLSQVQNLPMPVTILIGGVPSSDKLNAVVTLLRTPEKVGKILVGGSFLQPFHRALGHTTGDSEIVEESHVAVAKCIMQLARQHSVPLILASDALVVPTELVRDPLSYAKEGATDTAGALNMDYSHHAAIRLGLKRVPLSVAPTPPGQLFQPAREGRNASYEAISPDLTCVDIGTQTISAFCNEVSDSQFILMCGIMGMCEDGEYAHGTNSLLEKLAQCTEQGCSTILCGDDIVSALEHLHLDKAQRKQDHDEEQEPQGKAETGEHSTKDLAQHLRYSLVVPGGDCAVLSALAGMPLPKTVG